MRNNKVKLMCTSAIFVALVYVFTAFIHVPVHTGYAHTGDAFIYLAASMLPMPYAVFAGAFGAFLADFTGGYALWAPASAVIKALTVIFFTHKEKQLINKRNIIALILSALLCMGGYYLYEAIITQNFIAPTAGIVGNIMQSLVSSVLFIILGIAMDKLKLKEQLF